MAHHDPDGHAAVHVALSVAFVIGLTAVAIVGAAGFLAWLIR